MFSLILLFLLFCPFLLVQCRWTEEQANDWYGNLSFPVGSNYIPSYAVNQLEMWQNDTFNATRIDEELSWAQDLGMTTMRVFLHDLAYSEDPPGFKSRVETFLEISERHRIKILIVIFDSCWNPELKAGKQKEPRPGVHNSSKNFFLACRGGEEVLVV